MKKSQSIFLLSGLVPLVAAPIAIVASCSNDTAATTTFSLKGAEVTLSNLTDQKKELNQYVSDTAKLSQLIVAKKAEIFNNPPADLAASQVEIVGSVTQDATAGSLSFRLKVKTTATPPTDLIAETGLVLKGFATTQPPATQTPLDQAVAKIEAAHADGSFKLKDAKKTIPQSEIDTLKTNPTTFLTNYTDGLPNTDGFTTSVKTGNFNVADKSAKAKAQVITFKVTVTETATTTEKDTKDLTFDFTLEEPAPISAASVKDEIEKLETAGTFKLKDAKKTLQKTEVDQLPTKVATFLNDYTDGLTLNNDFNYVVENLVAEDNATKADQQRYIKFTIKVTSKTNANDTATTKKFS